MNTTVLARIGSFAARHPWRVLGAWLLAALMIGTAAGTVGGALVDNYSVPGTDAQKGTDLLRDRFPAFGYAQAQVVISADDAADDAAGPAAVEEVSRRLAAMPHVSAVSPPDISPDGRTVILQVRYDVPVTETDAATVAALEEAAAPARDAGLKADLAGEIVEDNQEASGAEGFGLMAALVILVFAFGSIIAAGLPIAMALAGLGVGFALITVVARFADISAISPTVASMVGIGVGIDYALFVVARHRQQLAQGDSVEQAITTANATAGRAVLFAGGTVVVALMGLTLAGIPNMVMMGVATALVVAVSAVAAVTLLPALLGLAGHRVLGRRKRRERFLREQATPHTTWSARWAAQTARHPWRYAAGAIVALVLLATPVLGMRIAQYDAGSEPTSNTARRAYDQVATAFGPGANGPLTVAIDLAGAPVDLLELRDDLIATPGVAAVDEPVLNSTRDAAVITVIPATGPQDEATTELVRRLRSDVLPGEASVTGWTAAYVDITQRLSDRLPLVVGTVVLASFLLLMLVFRSILVPLKAAVMNLLSIGAAYGVIVALFQWGWGTSFLGFEQAVPISPWVPVFMFAILFGLSMDYEVFLLSRVREEWLRTRDTTAAVVAGLGSTAKVISSAAVIMVTVFLGFALEGQVLLKMMGVGLATAVLVDATIVRLVLVPATMRLLGEANWWLPAWLDRILPRVSVEGAPAEQPVAHPVPDAGADVLEHGPRLHLPGREPEPELV